ncbi:DUF4097 domain-containing protein [Mucilaginibacter calamicampi]|uniref:DUF4097 domain-containing protein n=1 Tax=Mucilaginibacter calamicampi TaxID=1302352 RepID=A0ABW2YRA5_9SPHI
MKTFLLSITSLLALSFNAMAQETNYSFKESYKITTPAQLVISSHDGNIEVLPSDKNSVEVYYIVKRNNELLKIDRATLEKEVTLEVTSGANILKIDIKYPKNRHFAIINNRPIANLKIYVPKQTACNLQTADGNVSVTGLSSDQLIKTSDGNISVINIAGNVGGYTSDGNVMARAVKGDVDFKTSDGSISLDDIVGDVLSYSSDGHLKASKISGDILLKTSDGNIELSAIKGAVSASTSDGSIRGTVNEVKGEISLTTGDGNIDLTVPDLIGLNLDVEGSSIHTRLKNFSGSSQKRSIQGRLNGGGVPVKIKALNGNINLSYK